MWKDVGIVRSGSGLRNAVARLLQFGESLPVANSRYSWEARNMQQTALLIARSALAREESRGAHCRSDFPAHNDARFLKHSVMKNEEIYFE